MKLKQISGDFRVEELATPPSLTPQGEYTYFYLTKTNWTTTHALSEISRRCHTSRKRFNFAGSKDKRAVTKQIVCAWKVSPETLKSVNLKDIEIDVIGRGDEKINLGMLDKNKFDITIRDLDKAEPKHIEKYPNYFDDQRFGDYQNSHLIGKAILKGNLEEAAKLILNTKSIDIAKLKEQFKKGDEVAIINWLAKQPNDYAGAIRTLHKKIRMMYIHAYQSYLFNKALSELIRESSKNVIKIRIVGKECFVPTEPISIGPILELPGYESELKKDAYSKKIKQFLEKDRIHLEDFECERMPELAQAGSQRTAFVAPEDFKMGKLEKDDLNEGKYKVKVSFILPKGAYATLFLKILFP